MTLLETKLQKKPSRGAIKGVWKTGVWKKVL